MPDRVNYMFTSHLSFLLRNPKGRSNDQPQAGTIGPLRGEDHSGLDVADEESVASLF